MATEITDIVDALETEIASEVPTWKELPYKIDVEENNFRNQTDRFGVRALTQLQIDTVTKFLTFSGSFEVTLTQGYTQTSINDQSKRAAGLDLRALMLDLFIRFVNNKGGLPGTVLNITDLSQGEMIYLNEDKVAILRSTMDISYRLSLI